MATVTGITAQHMLEISDANIVAAEVVGNDLILTTRGGDLINAGNVRGLTGPTGPTGPTSTTVCTAATRPSNPIDGQQIFETDTLRTLYYYTAKSGWWPAWNTAWGNVAAMPAKVTHSATYTASGASDMSMASVLLRADRNYQAHLTTSLGLSANQVWSIDFSANNVVAGRFFLADTAHYLGYHYSGIVLYRPTLSAPYTLRVYHTEHTAGASLQYLSNATDPRQFWIEDIGPRV